MSLSAGEWAGVGIGAGVGGLVLILGIMYLLVWLMPAWRNSMWLRWLPWLSSVPQRGASAMSEQAMPSTNEANTDALSAYSLTFF